MLIWVKWSGLALFCALWGFVGTLAGVWVMADQVRGERGPAGPQGSPGAQGEVGPPPDMSEVTDEVETFMSMIEGSTANLNRRLEALEHESVSLTTFGCTAADPSVVTDVGLVPGIGYDPFLSVRRTNVCVR